MNIDWDHVRGEFPALETWTYINSATFGQMPRRANQAMFDHLARRDRTACSDFTSWFDDADRLRGSIGQLIHCAANDIAFVPNASTALGVLLGGLDWHAGDRIVTLEGEFPNNLYAPHFAGTGVEVVAAPWERFYDAITPRTRLVLLSMLNYASGFRPPLEEIAPYLRERGVLLYVDGTQGLGALRFDVRDIRPSMLAVHAYKWMLAPNGAGFFYIDPELRERIQPSVVGWRSDKRWRDVDHLHEGAPEFKAAAEKYEGGMISFALLYALEASIGLMRELGPENIERRVLGLADQLRAGLRAAGAEVADGATPIVSARFSGRDCSEMARALMRQRIVVSARHGFLRVSPHLYNNERDLSTLLDALAH
jgi:cysteine desulfurase / selenocysteine lyase